MPFMAFFCRPEKHSLIYMAALALMGVAEALRLVGMERSGYHKLQGLQKLPLLVQR